MERRRAGNVRMNAHACARAAFLLLLLLLFLLSPSEFRGTVYRYRTVYETYQFTFPRNDEGRRFFQLTRRALRPSANCGARSTFARISSAEIRRARNIAFSRNRSVGGRGDAGRGRGGKGGRPGEKLARRLALNINRRPSEKKRAEPARNGFHIRAR